MRDVRTPSRLSPSTREFEEVFGTMSFKHICKTMRTCKAVHSPTKNPCACGKAPCCLLLSTALLARGSHAAGSRVTYYGPRRRAAAKPRGRVRLWQHNARGGKRWQVRGGQRGFSHPRRRSAPASLQGRQPSMCGELSQVARDASRALPAACAQLGKCVGKALSVAPLCLPLSASKFLAVTTQ